MLQVFLVVRWRGTTKLLGEERRQAIFGRAWLGYIGIESNNMLPWQKYDHLCRESLILIVCYDRS